MDFRRGVPATRLVACNYRQLSSMVNMTLLKDQSVGILDGIKAVALVTIKSYILHSAPPFCGLRRF